MIPFFILLLLLSLLIIFFEKKDDDDDDKKEKFLTFKINTHQHPIGHTLHTKKDECQQTK